MRQTWEANRRCDVTFSLADCDAAVAAAEAVYSALDAAGFGFTARTGIGGWEGLREYATTVTLVGETPSVAAHVAIAAAHGAGCSAVQCERWAPEGYSVVEVRP